MKTLLTFSVLSLAAGLAAAQPHADADGDGNVTRDEFLAAQATRAEQRFAMLDANGDGVLSGDELTARRPHGPQGRRMQARGELDTDGDGALSLSELQAVRPELTVEQFNAMDTNGDGLIGADERPGPRFRNR